MSQKDDRVTKIIRELAANFIEREGNNTALITVSSVIIENRGKNALIGVTVLPDSKEEYTIDYLKRKKSDLRNYIKENSRLGIIPFIEIMIDRGEKNRQKIDELLTSTKNI